MIRWALAPSLAALLVACADAEFTVDAGARPDTLPPLDVWDQRAPDPDPGPSPDGGDPTPDGMPADPDAAPEATPDARPGPTPEACAPLDVCGVTCADLSRDPLNCGDCGRACAVRNGMAACVDGACAIGACDPGFVDVDGDPDTGCELESDCAPDTPCATMCDTEGTTACVDGFAECRPPAEQCNAIDDNCEGRCDEGLAGCRRPIHRSSGNGHLFTDDLARARQAPYRLEAEAFFHLYTDDLRGMRAVFLCRKPNGKYFLTNDTACEIQVAPERTIGYWSPRPLCGSVPLYRMYSPEGGNHFYTISAAERDNAVGNLGYLDEGTAGHVWRGP